MARVPNFYRPMQTNIATGLRPKAEAVGILAGCGEDCGVHCDDWASDLV